MELRPAALPPGWRICPLGDLVRIASGESPSFVQFAKDGVPYFKVEHLGRTEKYLGSAATPYRVQTDKVIPAGSIVFAKRGAAIALNRIRVLVHDAYMDTNLMALTPTAQLDAEFLYYGLSRIGLQQFADTTSIPQINNKHVHPIPFVLPPLDEQQEIAAALSDVDALLEGQDRLLAKKRDLRLAAIQQLVTGRTRLSDFTPRTVGSRYTEIGDLPRDWRVARLAELVDPSRSIRYGIVQPGVHEPTGRYMIRGQDYSQANGWARPSDVFRVSDDVESRYANARVKAQDLIMTIVGYCGHVEMVPPWLDGANLTQTTARISIRPDLAVSAYIKYALLADVGQAQVAAFLKGAAQPGLNCADVEQFLVPLPPWPEQMAIATALLDIDAELAALEARLDKSRALKQAMMQALLTGSTRLV